MLKKFVPAIGIYSKDKEARHLQKTFELSKKPHTGLDILGRRCMGRDDTRLKKGGINLDNQEPGGSIHHYAMLGLKKPGLAALLDVRKMERHPNLTSVVSRQGSGRYHMII